MSDCTLEELLQLALRTPEIGAVNFNYLYQVIHEILKHLGILSKPATLNAEYVNELQLDPDGNYIQLNLHQTAAGDGTFETVLENEATGDNNESEIKSGMQKEGERDSSDTVKGIGGEKSSDEKKKEETKDDGEEKEGTKDDGKKKEEAKDDGKKKEGTKDDGKKKEVIKDDAENGASGVDDGIGKEKKHSGKNVIENKLGGTKSETVVPVDNREIMEARPQSESRMSNADEGRKQSVAPQKRKGSLHILRQARSQMVPTSPRRKSILKSALSEKGFLNKQNDDDRAAINWEDVISVVRDSKTPVSDLWQILNTSRRLEAAEDTIHGMTSFIDVMSSDLSKVREAVDQTLADKQANNDDEDQKSQKPTRIKRKLLNKDLNEVKDALATSIKQLEERVNECATKEDIQDLCSSLTVEAIIEDRIASQSFGKQDGEQPSRNKMLYEAMSKIKKLEELVHFLAEELRNLEHLLDAKAAGKNEDVISKINREMKGLNDEVKKQQLTSKDFNSMQANLEKINEESKNLRRITSQTAREQAENCKCIEKIKENIEHLTDALQNSTGGSTDSYAPKSNTGTVEAVKKLLAKLQGEHRLLEDQVFQINRTMENNCEQLSSAGSLLKDIQENKVDKDNMNKLMDVKADKALLEEKISKNYFDSLIAHLDKNLQDMIYRLDGQEAVWKNLLSNVETKIDKKANEDELKKLKEGLEIQLKNIKESIPKPATPEDDAAGIRKQLLRDYQCISCSKPLEIIQRDAVTTLPAYHPLPGNQSIRPYTTFEIEGIRKDVRGFISNKDRFDVAQERERIQRQLLRLCGVQDLESLAFQTTRACGGSHTFQEMQRRNSSRPNVLSRESTYGVNSPDLLVDIEVMGKDGRVYRSRQDPLPPLAKQQQTSVQSTSNAGNTAGQSMKQSSRANTHSSSTDRT